KMRAGQAGPALGVKAGLVAPVTVRVYFTRPRAGTDQTNGRPWPNQKPRRGFPPNRLFIIDANGTSGDERHRRVRAGLAFSCEGSSDALWAITQFQIRKRSTAF